jgi:hypothetical protein
VGDLRKRLDHAFIKPAVRALQPWRHVTYGNVRVSYKRYLDGGGSAFGQDYICAMARTMGLANTARKKLATSLKKLDSQEKPVGSVNVSGSLPT